MTRRASRAQSGKNDFADWLQTIPDQIASHSAEGRPIVVGDPGTDYGRRLVEALGAEIRPLAICTRDHQCTADVDGHQNDCPIEIDLRETFGF